jgi:hypothetical protein
MLIILYTNLKINKNTLHINELDLKQTSIIKNHEITNALNQGFNFIRFFLLILIFNY